MSRDLIWDAWYPVLEPSGLSGIHQVQQVAISETATITTWRVESRTVATLIAEVIGIPSAGAAAAAQDIDFLVHFGAAGETLAAHSVTDTARTYDLTGTAGTATVIADLTPLFADIGPGDIVACQVTHNTIGGPIDYLGIRFSHAWY